MWRPSEYRIRRTPQEADELVDTLGAIDRKIDLHQRKRSVIKELFKALLHKLMTGEIRVDELDLSKIGQNNVSTGGER